MSQPLSAVANCPDIKCSTKDRQDLAQEGQWRPLLSDVGVVQKPRVRECQYFKD